MPVEIFVVTHPRTFATLSRRMPPPVRKATCRFHLFARVESLAVEKRFQVSKEVIVIQRKVRTLWRVLKLLIVEAWFPFIEQSSSLTHLISLIALGAYCSQIWRWMSSAVMFLAVKNRITDYWPYFKSVGCSIDLNKFIPHSEATRWHRKFASDGCCSARDARSLHFFLDYKRLILNRYLIKDLTLKRTLIYKSQGWLCSSIVNTTVFELQSPPRYFCHYMRQYNYSKTVVSKIPEHNHP